MSTSSIVVQPDQDTDVNATKTTITRSTGLHQPPSGHQQDFEGLEIVGFSPATSDLASSTAGTVLDKNQGEDLSTRRVDIGSAQEQLDEFGAHEWESVGQEALEEAVGQVEGAEELPSWADSVHPNANAELGDPNKITNVRVVDREEETSAASIFSGDGAAIRGNEEITDVSQTMDGDSYRKEQKDVRAMFSFSAGKRDRTDQSSD